jgi:hypothetical protein
MKRAAFQASDEVLSVIRSISECLHRARLEELGRLGRQLLGILERTEDRRRAACARFLSMLETAVRREDLPLTIGAQSALLALGQNVAAAVRFGQPALRAA